MKIIGGQFKGRNIYMPLGVRSTQDLVRKAFFDIIGQDLEGLTFLDLFAGSGAIGLEAISRNAKRVFFVEGDARCAAVIQENLSTIGIASRDNFGLSHFVMNKDAFVAIKDLSRRAEKFDIIFADPPFGVDLAKKTLKTLEGYDIVHPTSLVIIQHDKKESLPDMPGRFLRVKEKKYGKSILTLFKIHSNGTSSNISGQF